MSAEYQDYGWNDRSLQSTGYLYPVLREMLRYDKSKRILDMGCGNGEIANLLLAEGFDVMGIDASVTGVEVANKKNPGRFFVHDVSQEKLPAEVADIPFDIVISTEVIEHLYAPRAYMRLIQKTLQAKHGQVILSTPYHGYLKNVALALMGKMDRHYTALWDGGHIKFWSRQTLTSLLEEFGFRVTDFRGAGRLPYLWKSMIIRASLRTP
jgi:2-polyprenyl-3-methyl-5-hydroxy-6-metoxy-1,4-benzoquinol methylase